MLMTGDPITAQEAHRLGMVNEIYAQTELMEAAHRIAREDREQLTDRGAGGEMVGPASGRVSRSNRPSRS